MLDAGCLMALQKVKHVGCSMKCFAQVQIFHPKSHIRKFIKNHRAKKPRSYIWHSSLMFYVCVVCGSINFWLILTDYWQFEAQKVHPKSLITDKVLIATKYWTPLILFPDKIKSS